MKRSFVELCAAGLAHVDDVDDYVDRWHGQDADVPLHEYLGMSQPDYALWVRDPSVLGTIVAKHRRRSVDARTIVGAGHPTEDGRRLADAILDDPATDWEHLEVDLSRVPPRTLVSAFFFAFFSRIWQQDPGKIWAVLLALWKTEHDFQREAIARFTHTFKSRLSMRPISDVAKELRTKYGMTPPEPSADQISAIIDKVATRENELGRNATEDEIAQVVSGVCPSFGTYNYPGTPLSDTRALLVESLESTLAVAGTARATPGQEGTFPVPTSPQGVTLDPRPGELDEALEVLRAGLRSEDPQARDRALQAAGHIDAVLSRGGTLPLAWARISLRRLRDLFDTSATETGRLSSRAQEPDLPMDPLPVPAPPPYDPRAWGFRKAYTIGHHISYDHSLASEPEVKKLGRTDDYEGGWVFRTAAEARGFMTSPAWAALEVKRDAANYAVYELELPGPWSECASAKPAEDGVHRLLISSRIVRKVAE